MIRGRTRPGVVLPPALPFGKDQSAGQAAAAFKRTDPDVVETFVRIREIQQGVMAATAVIVEPPVSVRIRDQQTVSWEDRT